MKTNDTSSGIYAILNLVNGHRYIGSAINLKNRCKRHTTDLNRGIHHNQYLQRAFNQYGRNSFEFEILSHCLPNDLLTYEQFYIDKLHPEYNIEQLAGSSRGTKRSVQTRIKISLAQRGKKLSDQHKQRISQGAKGHKPCDFSEEWREKQRQSQTGKKHAPFTEEHCRRLREAALRRKSSPEYGEYLRKLSETRIGNHPSIEARAKMSQSAKNRIQEGRGLKRNEKGIFVSSDVGHSDDQLSSG